MRLNVSNNTICYLWELRDLSRDEFEFQELIEEVLLEVSDWISVHFPVLKPSKLPFSEMAEDVRKAHESEEHKRRFSDTLMKFSHLDGDVAKLKLYRSQLDDIISIGESSTKQEEQNELFNYSIQRTVGRETNYKLAVRLEL
jgi:hypothetical protein